MCVYMYIYICIERERETEIAYSGSRDPESLSAKVLSTKMPVLKLQELAVRSMFQLLVVVYNMSYYVIIRHAM